MNSIGLDFGTTYSVVAVPKDAAKGNYAPRAVMLYDEDKSPFYDSLALLEADGSISYGRRARRNIVLDGTTPYKGFKLMLAETDSDVLRSRGYSAAITPEAIVKGYLEDLLMSYKARFGEIDRLVIGVPEIWEENNNERMCYERLNDIVKSLGVAKEVLLLSEPTCACAYYIEHYKQTNGGKLFEGNILIVDYGGGTLDIALCEVEIVDGKPKVTPRCRSGAGANEEGIIGKAGFAFMEEVVRLALLAGEVPQEDIDSEKNRGSFYECVYRVEDAFKEFSTFSKDNEELKYFQETFAVGDLKDKYDNNEVFTKISFFTEVLLKGKPKKVKDDYDVTYGMIARAFNEKIRPVLDEKLDVIIKYMDEKKIAHGVDADNFKVQMIGGFCNFYLVEKEITQKLGRAARKRDKRYKDELTSSDERTMAVAYGASLLANEQTDYGFVSQYSLGIPVRYQNKPDIIWAIKRGMDLITDKVYLFKLKGGNAAPLSADGIAKVIYEGSYKQEEILIAPKYAGLLRINQDDDTSYFVGMSQDRSRIISFHLWEILDVDAMSGKLAEVEDMIAASKKIKWLKKVKEVRLSRARKLGGDDAVVRPAK